MMTMNILSENDKNLWRNIKKVIEKQYKGKSGIYKININDNEYLAGIANRIDKKVISLINELLFEKNTDVSKILFNMSPETFNLEVFEENEESIKLLQNSILDLGKPVIRTSLKEKELFKPPEEYRYQYRANINTVYMAHDKESLQQLLDRHGINVNVDELYEVQN